MCFKEIALKDLNSINPFVDIGENWMLITAGDEKNFNTMTASWGTLGVLWNKPITTCFVRPQRYTFDFIEKNEYYTISFYDDDYKQDLKICGTTSGRDTNKIEKTRFTPRFENSVPYFNEARLVFICKKIYSRFMDPSCMLESSLNDGYSNNDYHKMYIGEIIKCLVKK